MEYDDDAGISRKPIASFFKLILQPRLDLLRLKIPTEFMATHGKDLSNVIYLTTPPGKVWKFELTAEDGKTLLQKGWPEFVKFYSVSHGHLLVFKYQGKSRFDLVILDRSASEIEYPLDPQPCRENPSKKRKTTLITKSSTTSKKDDKLVIAAHRGSSNLSQKEYERIRAYASSRCKHPSFAAKMRSSFVNCYYMGVPKQFAKLYLENEPYSEYRYRFQTDDEDGKTWEVDVVDDSSRVRFRKGWKDFVLENKLKVDDICIFELISKQEIKVHVLVTVANAQGNLAIK